ncbi:MAG: DNA replication/repair protein RecF [Gammaproteobacteria bacterium]|nr:DNA replication/repair protein RecF [Gammaproteobacteria bacterium]
MQAGDPRDTDEMSLVKLGIRSVRNLESVDIFPSANLNLIIGKNASGKTSFLEAIYILGRGKSFRPHSAEKVIQVEHPSLSVFGIVEEEHGREVRIGLERSHSELKLRIDGEKANKVSELATLLPIQIIHPNSHKLFEEGPRFRRNYLDWGVFHVEQLFFPAWRRYQRGLKQRNAALRARKDKDTATAWDPEIIDAATIIHECRDRYVEMLKKRLPDYIEPIMDPLSLEVYYQRGWSQSESYKDALKGRLDQDFEQGYTKAGPHRADLQFKVDGINATERVSRGQQKILVASCLLAQAGIYSELSGRRCVLLVDDLAAELDLYHRKKLINALAEMDAQVFITAIEAEQLLDGLPDVEMKMFHVEHGKLKEMVQ